MMPDVHAGIVGTIGYTQTVGKAIMPNGVGNDVHTVGFVFLWFVIPLLLVLGVDVLVVRRRERRNTRKASLYSYYCR